MDTQIQHRMMENQAILTKGARQRTRMLTLLCGWIPLSLGVRIRNLMYKLILRSMGRAVNTEVRVGISDGACVEIASYVCISQGSVLDAHNNDRIVLDSHVFVDRNVRISSGKEGGLVQIQAWASLDRGVDIKTHGQGKTIIGKHTYIGPYSCLSGYGDITIGDHCLIASHTSIYAHNYNFEDVTALIGEQGYRHRGITIGDNCWIGSGVRIVDGVTIGAGSVIGAGAVVTKDIPPNSVAVGTPAKVVKTRGDRAIAPAFAETFPSGL